MTQAPTLPTARFSVIPKLVKPVLRHWPWVAMLSSLLMLAIAHGFETFLRLAPCELCLKARGVYWVAAGVAAVLALARLTPMKPPRATNLLLALVFLGGTGLAAYHAGVEWHFWPGPKSCTGGNVQVSLADMTRLLNHGPIGAPACDKAAWRWLGLSMAGWNVLVSLKLTVLSVLAARAPATEPR